MEGWGTEGWSRAGLKVSGWVGVAVGFSTEGWEVEQGDVRIRAKGLRWRGSGDQWRGSVRVGEIGQGVLQWDRGHGEHGRWCSGYGRLWPLSQRAYGD